MAKISTSDLQDMIRHWLETPVNGYLGSGYGSIVPDLLMQPQKTGKADAVLTKLRNDVPLAGALPSSALNIFMVQDGPDKKRLYIDAAGQDIDLGTT
jgi:hypothetical protein